MMLIGRESDLARISEAMGRSRLVTLTGPGGVGKTALARATEFNWPKQGILFADLTSLNGDNFAEGVAGTLGFSAFDRLLADLGDRPSLVILDNCEHVLDESAELAQLLLDSTAVSLLATSRERLDTEHEHVIRIEPLSATGVGSPAAALFTAAAEARGGVVADDPTAVAELCRRLDGLPLALELAAARAASMTAAEMLVHLDTRLDLLARSRARGVERHRSVGAAIAWSYQDLEPDDQRAFEALSVFSAPFTADMAAHTLEHPSPMTAITLLVERSLLVHEPTGSVSWYRMLETIRTFARERLDTSGARQAAERRLLDHLTERAARTAAARVMADPTVPDEFGRSYRNVHWAVEKALADNDEERCHTLIAPLWWLEDTGHQQEGADLIARVLEQFPGPSAAAGVSWGILSVLGRLSATNPTSRGAAENAITSGGAGAAYGHRTLGMLERAAANWQAAHEHFGAGAAAARAAQSEGLAAEIEMHGALTLARQGQVDEAIAQLEQLYERTASQPLANAWVADFLAYVLLAREPLRAARLAYDTLERVSGWRNAWLTASAHTNIGAADLLAGDAADAAEHIAAAIEAFLGIHNRIDIGLAIQVAPAVFAALDDVESAQRSMLSQSEYIESALGGFERDLFSTFGAVPPPGADAQPLEAREIVQRLREVARRSDHGHAAEEANVFRRSGDMWTIAYAGTTIHQRDSKGLADLAALIAAEGSEIAAVDLADASVIESSAGPVSDSTARRQYEARIRELQEDIDEADGFGDSGRRARAEAELDVLVERLGAAYGLGGRDRPEGETAEKARSAVTWRMRAAIKRIRQDHPELGEHLDRSIRTGRFCAYAPDRVITWEVSVLS